MKFNEKKVEKILKDIADSLDFAYVDTSNKRVNEAKSKLRALLELIEFE